MKETSQMPSSTSLMPRVWPAKTVERLIFLRCRQMRPQAVTTMSALDSDAHQEAAGEWPRHHDVEHHHRQRVDDRTGRNIAVVSLRGADLAVDQYRARH